MAFIVATSACWGESCRAMRVDVAEDLSTAFIRGTKRSTRLRTVPIVGEVARSLLEYALANGQGAAGLLFQPWTNVRRDLHAACGAVKIRPCSPNDLRRTRATWLRARRLARPHRACDGPRGHENGRAGLRPAAARGPPAAARSRHRGRLHRRCIRPGGKGRTRRIHRIAGSSVFAEFGAWGRNRTTDTGIFSPLLYRLSYPGVLAVHPRASEGSPVLRSAPRGSKPGVAGRRYGFGTAFRTALPSLMITWKSTCRAL